MDTTSLKTVIKALSDGLALASDVTTGFSFKEIGEAIAVGNDVQAVKAVLASVVPTWETLDDAARADLVATVKSEVKFPKNGTAEAYVQKVVNVAAALSAAYQAWNA